MRHLTILLFLIAILVSTNAKKVLEHRTKNNEWSNYEFEDPHLKGQNHKEKGKNWLFSYWPFARWPITFSPTGPLLGAGPFEAKPEHYLGVCQNSYRQYEIQQDVIFDLRETQKNFQRHTEASAIDDTEQVIDAFQSLQLNLPDQLAAVEGAIYAIANLSNFGIKSGRKCVSKVQNQVQLTQGSLHELEKEVSRSADHLRERTDKDRFVQIQSHLSQLMEVVKETLRSPRKEQLLLTYNRCKDTRPTKRMQQARDALLTIYDYETLNGQDQKTKGDAIETVTGILLQGAQLHAICRGVEHYESSERTQRQILEQDIERVSKIFDQVKTTVHKIARGSKWFI